MSITVNAVPVNGVGHVTNRLPHSVLTSQFRGAPRDAARVLSVSGELPVAQLPPAAGHPRPPHVHSGHRQREGPRARTRLARE